MLTLGQGQTLPGFPAVEQGIPNGPPPAAIVMPSEDSPIGSRLEQLIGTPFDLHQIPVHALTINAQASQPWQMEYSADSQQWNGNGPARMPIPEQQTSGYAFPPAGGSFRARSFWPRRVLTIKSSQTQRYFAVPTEPGRSYCGDMSSDLESWFCFSVPRPGDGSVFLYSLPPFGDRTFLRVRRF